MYLLDTNACIGLLNGTADRLATRLQEVASSDLRLCSVVKAELLYGARRSARPASNLRLLARFFEPFASMPFDDRCAEEAGTIRAELARCGSPIGPNDLLIAATAKAHGLTLITHNTREFARVPGLGIVDWLV